MLVVDPMHALFLGIAKHYTKRVFIGKNLLNDADFEVIQKRVNSIVAPSDVGRIPQKIQSSFSSFTADQFKNWVIHYSIIAMHGMLSSEHLECWRHFVLACRIFCQRSISKDRLKVADILLLRFCQRTERQYGRDIITPNMHMACHLSECVMDYGPLNHFWLFAFERFNEILGLLPNNNKSIETQMMRQFLNDQKVMWLPFSNEFQQDFEGLLASIRNDIIDGTLASDSSRKSDFDVSNFLLTSGTNITISRSCIRSVL